MRAVPPHVKTIQQPIQFLNRQHNGFVGEMRRCFEAFGFGALELKAKAVALPIKDFHPITGAIQKNEKHGVEHGDLDINFTRAARPSMDFRKSTGFG
jgi:hypothetical protein